MKYHYLKNIEKQHSTKFIILIIIIPWKIETGSTSASHRTLKQDLQQMLYTTSLSLELSKGCAIIIAKNLVDPKRNEKTN